MTTYKKQQGLSLIELLVALALAASLSTAIYQIVLSNRVNIELVESHSKVQESARIALDMMARDFRMAGYTGCVDDTDNIDTFIQTSGSGYDAVLHNYTTPNIVKMWGTENYQSSNKIGGVKPVLGSDVFYSRGATSSDLYLNNSVAVGDTSLTISGPKRELDIATKVGTVLMVSDCEKASIFAVSSSDSATGEVTFGASVAGGPNNGTTSMARTFTKGSQVLIMNSFAYFIGESSIVKDKSGTKVNSLYKYSMLGSANASELVPYVKSLNFTYGVDTNNDQSVDVYRTADSISNLVFSGNVKSIQIEMVIAGDTDIGANNSDGYLEKTYRRVVQIRNSHFGDGGP